MTDTHAIDPVDTSTVPAGSRIWRWPVVLLVGLLLAAGVKGTLVEAWFVPGDAMAPVLQAGDRVLVVKAGGAPARGDVVVADVSDAFPGPDRATHTDDGAIGRALAALADRLGVRGGSRSVVARVAAVAGDTVACCTGDRITVNGEEAGTSAGGEAFSLDVPAGSVWLLAERAEGALDSRAVVDDHGRGVVPVDAVVGQVVFRYWPLTAIGPVPSEAGS